MRVGTVRLPSKGSSLITTLLLCLTLPVNSLYFFLEGTTPKCFYEDLPKDTLVVGKLHTETASTGGRVHTI